MSNKNSPKSISFAVHHPQILISCLLCRRLKYIEWFCCLLLLLWERIKRGETTKQQKDNNNNNTCSLLWILIPSRVSVQKAPREKKQWLLVKYRQKMPFIVSSYSEWIELVVNTVDIVFFVVTVYCLGVQKRSYHLKSLANRKFHFDCSR